VRGEQRGRRGECDCTGEREGVMGEATDLEGGIGGGGDGSGRPGGGGGGCGRERRRRRRERERGLA
jgi:hypothetical protein